MYRNHKKVNKGVKIMKMSYFTAFISCCILCGSDN